MIKGPYITAQRRQRIPLVMKSIGFGAKTTAQIAEETGIDARSLRQLLTYMHRTGQIYISGWQEPTASGNRARRYAPAFPGCVDVKKPDPVPQWLRAQRWRDGRTPEQAEQDRLRAKERYEARKKKQTKAEKKKENKKRAKAESTLRVKDKRAGLRAANDTVRRAALGVNDPLMALFGRH